MKRTYPFLSLLSLLLMATLSACGSHKTTSPILIEPQAQKPHPTSKPQSPQQQQSQDMQRITDLMLQAQQPTFFEQALDELQQLAQRNASPDVRQEAAFRRVQLLLQYQKPQADLEAQFVLLNYPNHSLVPYTHFWLAQWWMAQAPQQPDDGSEFLFGQIDYSYTNHVLSELTAALRHPKLTPELMKRAIALSNQVIIHADLEHTVPWYIAVARVDYEHRDYWLQILSNTLNLDDIQRLQQQGVISPEQDLALYQQLARQAMMKSDTQALQRLQMLLQSSTAAGALRQHIQSWLSGSLHPVRIGVLLPLSGPYARFGQQALDGIRLAVETSNHQNSLWIQDTAHTGINDAYQALLAEHVDWIIGPLLSKNTEALAPLLNSEIPVMSLSMDNSIATASPALFIHNLAPETQARFLASYAISQGMHRVAVIQNSSHSAERESLAFISRFADLGGEIADAISLDEHSIDHRPMLNQLRENSDDEALLHRLIMERALFIANDSLDIYLPPNMDALYLAMNGKQVSELAGQLAYVDIRSIPLLGGSRWMDGHLLDDRGRNLSTARFIQDDSSAHHSDLSVRYQEVWGSGHPSKLFTIAYDSAHIIMLLTGKLGLTGSDALQALHTSEGFPAESGHVYFNADGLGEKTFSLYRIQRHDIVPAQ